jgi:ubiquinone/menaquinone biosynthesis C-methylase UbiE
MSQQDIFLAGEGDQWFARNGQVLHPERDDYVALLRQLAIEPQQVLEIGCANGYHLEALRQAFNCQAHGIEPSQAAVDAGQQQFPQLQLTTGSARQLPYAKNRFDLVILGFCLYLCDREDLFIIAAEVDRVLKDGGFVLIKDFCPPIAYRNPYEHQAGIYSFKMDYGRLFTWNPGYQLLAFQRMAHADETRRYHPDEQIAIQVLRKDLSAFAMERPFRE